MRRSRTLWVAEAGLTLALAWVLGTYLKLWTMPYGGSVSLEMVPLFFFAYRWGGKSGMALGVAYGLLNYITSPWFVHWSQVILDYPAPFALLGLAGYFRKLPLWVGLVAGTVARFVPHFLAGVLFWYEAAPEGMSPVLYSALYNTFYLVPSLLLAIAVFYAIWPTAKRNQLV